jgi:hypothetical protein
MKTQEQVRTVTPRRTDVRPHRLGMGWHFVWRYDPPIVHQGQREDRSSYEWEEEGETSEGCIMWLADEFARQEFGDITSREIYREAYKERDGADFDDAWLATDALRDEWAEYTVLPKRWTATQVRKLFEDLEDVNYHSFSGKLIELVKERTPELATVLADWCQETAQ